MRFIFGNFQIWCMKIPAEKHHFPSYITTFIFIINQIWILLLRIFLGDFVGLGKGELTCKRGEEKSELDIDASLSPLLWFSPLSFHHGPVWLKLLYLVKGNWSLGINKTVRSNLFSLFNLCFEYRMFFCAYFHDCLV